MKIIFTFILLIFTTGLFAQQHACALVKQRHMQSLMEHEKRTSNLSSLTSHELKYDVKFVHLMLNLERTNKDIQGGVKTVATVTASAMDTFMCLLHQNHTIDSIRFNGTLMGFVRKDSAIKVTPATPIPNGQSFTVSVYYHGTAPVGGSAIGSGFDNGTDWGNQATWSLSEAIVAYHWWPCKQILTDKIDSSWVFITTDSTNKVGSNGLLSNVVVVGNQKRYEWKNNHMINYYLISVAVSDYEEYKLYAKPQYLGNDSILIQNYVYNNMYNSQYWLGPGNFKALIDSIVPVINFYCKTYGMYPFYKQKYGHSMAPFGGGMEHQTMTTLGYFDYYVDAHELGHQWWGDNVTCKSWGDIFMNESFAVYSEILTSQYVDPASFTSKVIGAQSSAMSQLGGSIYFTGSDTLNSTRIFDSRLTYDKGGAVIHTLRFVTNNDSLWFQTLRGFQTLHKNSTASVIDFMNYYHAQTSIDPTQFFNQWYYGEGYPTFNVTWNFIGNTAIIKSIQTTSTPSSVPVFITPIEYKIKRVNAADTVIRVMHTNSTEMYTIPALSGSITSIVIDPNNWLINRIYGPPYQDTTLTLPAGIIVNKINNYQLVISPNPSNGIFNFKMNNYFQNNYSLTDISGKIILKGTCLESNNIDISDKANGIYMLQIKDKQNKLLDTRKLIKE